MIKILIFVMVLFFGVNGFAGRGIVPIDSSRTETKALRSGSLVKSSLDLPEITKFQKALDAATSATCAHMEALKPRWYGFCRPDQEKVRVAVEKRTAAEHALEEAQKSRDAAIVKAYITDYGADKSCDIERFGDYQEVLEEYAYELIQKSKASKKDSEKISVFDDRFIPFLGFIKSGAKKDKEECLAFLVRLRHHIQNNSDASERHHALFPKKTSEDTLWLKGKLDAYSRRPEFAQFLCLKSHVVGPTASEISERYGKLVAQWKGKEPPTRRASI